MISVRNLLILVLMVQFGVVFGSQSKAADKTSPFLKPDDVVVFMGDSITVASVSQDGFVTLISQGVKKAMPDSKVQFFTAAKGGCGIGYLNTCFDSKVKVHKPNVVVILIGINDVRLIERKLGATPEKYEELLEKLVKRCQEIGARTVICSPLVRGEKTEGSNQYDALIEKYVAACKKVAEKTSSMYIDTHALFLKKLKEVNTKNEDKGNLTKDGVHPNKVGNALIADAILEAWGIKK